MVVHLTSEAQSNPTNGPHKKHRAKHSGPKSAKKLAKSPGQQHPQQQQHNVKAFAVQRTTKAARLVQRTLDYQTRKHHVPQSEHIVDFSPPVVVALVGPPKSGKSTLLKSLVKHFCHQVINVIKGPLTVVVGKKLRLTFIECGCDINSMLDAAKIADVVLLMVNVRFGLEMYHFEFINMIQVHGMPRVIPVLNHLDTFKDSSSSRAARRKIKQRLWVDLNSKIFLLTRFQPKKYPTSEIPVNDFSKPGDYLLAEVRRLARMIVVKIPRPTDWRTNHPYLLVDRLEDITDSSVLSKSPTADRSVSMYGWVRGAPLPPALTSPEIHIAGLGDFTLAGCTRQPDPCPLPCQLAQNAEKSSRHLAERERKIYAPMSSLGGVLFDRDATYIDLGGSHYLSNQTQHNRSRQPKAANQAALDEMHSTLTKIGGLDEQLDREHQVRFLNDASYLRADAFPRSDIPMETNTSVGSQPSDSESEPEPDVPLLSDNLLAGFLIPPGSKHSPELTGRPQSSKPVSSQSIHQTVKEVLDDITWQSTTPSRINWNRLIYGADLPLTKGVGTASLPLIAGLFQPTDNSLPAQGAHDFTLFASPVHLTALSVDWSQPASFDRIVNRFTTGKWGAGEDAESLLQTDAQVRARLVAEESRKHAAAASNQVNYKPTGGEEAHNGEDPMEISDNEDEGLEDDAFHDSDSGSDSAVMDTDQDSNGKEPDPTAEYEKRLLMPTKRQKLLEKRKRHKALFDKLYEAAAGGTEATAFYEKLVAAKEAQLAANKAVLEKLPEDVAERLEGFPPGAYVRLELNDVPYQFIERFNPCQPLVAGGLPSAEESMGYLQVRMRTHRWLKRVLRSNDPITVSIGWRRYQTVAVYSKEEHNFRNRFLKYSLPHEHCLMTIYGPLVPPKTGVILFVNSAWRSESDDSDLPTFRVAGTGSVLSTDQSFQIMKKLKLVGEPFKIFAKTAFVRGMFNSALEVNKMIGARIQTVSNVRGLIKAALTNSSVAKPGDFRATFEAQITKSDLVFLRTFVAVRLQKYYNPVLNRLCPVEGEQVADVTGQRWRLLRTLAELRKEAGQNPVHNTDSQYKPIHRPVFIPAPLYVPTKLISALPFANKPKPSRKEARQMLGGDPVQLALSPDLPAPVTPAALRDTDTKQELLTRLRQLHADFKRRQREKMIARVTKHKKELFKNEQRRAQSERQRRKSFFARQGNKRNRRAEDNEN